MDSTAAIPAARLRHSKHLQLNRLMLTAVINAIILICLVVPLGWATARLDTGDRGWAIACLTILCDIVIHWPSIS